MEECDEQSAVWPGRNEKHVWGSPGKDPTGERVDGRGLTFILQAPGGGCLQRCWREGHPQILLKVPLRWEEVHRRGQRLSVADRRKMSPPFFSSHPWYVGKGEGGSAPWQ